MKWLRKDIYSNKELLKISILNVQLTLANHPQDMRTQQWEKIDSMIEKGQMALKSGKSGCKPPRTATAMVTAAMGIATASDD